MWRASDAARGLVITDPPIWYTGIGSRRAPLTIIKRCAELAVRLQELGLSLRTGDATGCDAAFRLGAGGAVRSGSLPGGLTELQAPNGTLIHVFKPCDEIGWRLQALRGCLDYEEDFGRRPLAHRKLLLRNMAQVSGRTGFEPSEFVVYWAPVPHKSMIDRHDSRGGGTRYAVRRAHLSGVRCMHMEEMDNDQIVRAARKILRNRGESGTITSP